MKKLRIVLALFVGWICVAALATSPVSASSSYQSPTWWGKAQHLLNSGSTPGCGLQNRDFSQGTNVDMSDELTPQSETSIAVNPNDASDIVGGSNEIFCLPMRAYSSTRGGRAGSWTRVDLPLPAPLNANGNDFGSDPGVAWDGAGNVYYSYIVVFFNPSFRSITGTEMAVARSSDLGVTWTPTYFNQNIGTGKFNDKPMITVDRAHHNTIYVAWDNASFNQGKSSNNDVILVSHSTDGGVTFSAPVAASPAGGGQAAVIGADPFVGPDGALHVAWQDAINPAIRVATSTDGGNSFGPAVEIAPTTAVFQALPPAQAVRGALIYPACAAAFAGPNAGHLYCSWSDETADRGMDVFVSVSTDGGGTWSTPGAANDDTGLNDQFNQWLTTDPSTGKVVLSWNDSRNDPTRHGTDIFFTSSVDGVHFTPNTQVTNAPTDETVSGADPFGNQYGDYEGITALNGVAHPIWTDRRESNASLDEEIFTSALKIP
ncbi:MAG TPA: sialidase family protein [Candidatus Dormibacteraeota bacterium]|nr:sialidase family protein [Candidatus Dormibacteraeota bacterium]